MARKVLSSALLAAAIFSSPSAAQTVPDMTEEEVDAFVRVALPGALLSMQEKCRNELPEDAYIYASGDEVHARFLAAADDAWPTAVGMIARAASRDNPAMGEVMAGMPAEVLQPFVEEMIAGMVTNQVEAKHCDRINQGLELLDPLPPENLAALIGMAYALSQEGKEQEQPTVQAVGSP